MVESGSNIVGYVMGREDKLLHMTISDRAIRWNERMKCTAMPRIIRIRLFECSWSAIIYLIKPPKLLLQEILGIIVSAIDTDDSTEYIPYDRK